MHKAKRQKPCILVPAVTFSSACKRGQVPQFPHPYNDLDKISGWLLFSFIFSFSPQLYDQECLQRLYSSSSQTKNYLNTLQLMHRINRWWDTSIQWTTTQQQRMNDRGTPWVNFMCIRLSDRSQTQNYIYFMIYFI